MGFVGVLVTLALLLAFVVRTLSLTFMPGDTLGLFIVLGVGGMFVFHMLVNVGMVIGFMPITGIPLPFLSYGGSSVLTRIHRTWTDCQRAALPLRQLVRNAFRAIVSAGKRYGFIGQITGFNRFLSK